MAKKRRTREEIKNTILNYLESIDFPTTTTFIADGVGLNWYSAKAYLLELKGEMKVYHKKIGRQDQWWTENVNESRRMVRELKEIVVKLTETVGKLRKENVDLKNRLKGFERK